MHPLRYSKFKSMENFEKKELQKTKPNTEKPQKNRIPPPVIDCRPNNAKFILHVFKKKKLLLQTSKLFFR